MKSTTSTEIGEQIISGYATYSVNDNFLRKPINKKKYILQENDIKVIISENVSLHSLETLSENITVELLSNRIKE